MGLGETGWEEQKEEEFIFRRYVYTPQGTSPFGLFDMHSHEIVLSRREALALLALAMTMVVALALLPS